MFYLFLCHIVKLLSTSVLLYIDHLNFINTIKTWKNLEWEKLAIHTVHCQFKYSMVFLTANTINIMSLKVVSTAFLLVCFVNPKESTYETGENVFYFTLKALFCSWDNQILTCQIFKRHQMPKHETQNTFTEQLGK